MPCSACKHDTDAGECRSPFEACAVTSTHCCAVVIAKLKMSFTQCTRLHSVRNTRVCCDEGQSLLCVACPHPVMHHPCDASPKGPRARCATESTHAHIFVRGGGGGGSQPEGRRPSESKAARAPYSLECRSCRGGIVSVVSRTYSSYQPASTCRISASGRVLPRRRVVGDSALVQVGAAQRQPEPNQNER